MDRLQKTYKKVMDGVKKAIERYPQHMVSSLFISISVYFLSNLVAYAKFDSRIDYIQQSVLFNISGNYSPAHTVFSNVFLTCIVSALPNKCVFIS